MSQTTEHVFIEALSLPAQERASLVHRLLQSLEPAAASPEIEAAWKAEAIERCKAFDRGELQESRTPRSDTDRCSVSLESATMKLAE